MPADGRLDLSVVVPVRDEALNVDPFYVELAAVLARLRTSYETLFIEDGSVDDTFRRLSHIQAHDPHVRVVRFARNFGQTAAFGAGFAYARGRLIVTIDGDLQNDPADIPRMLELAASHDIVCGWRRRRRDAFLTRHVPSVVANWLIGLVTGVRLHDNGCSLKVFRADVVRPLKLRTGMHRYLPAVASQLGGRVAEVEVNHRPRIAGRSKYGLSRTFRVVADLMRLRSLMRQAVDPSTPAPVLYEVAACLPPGPT
jgi:glycosyltransferase involved in cell wall biosynthesis